MLSQLIRGSQNAIEKKLTGRRQTCKLGTKSKDLGNTLVTRASSVLDAGHTKVSNLGHSTSPTRAALK
ncbi:hypothetical protein O3P69_002100 [Scylla paramamosain]|uniref:Uncharacterized protein n=1 Tax=Scylla paramamosain TaxID=85552 RepID=A0AAW0V7Z1_SCYPA